MEEGNQGDIGSAMSEDMNGGSDVKCDKNADSGKTNDHHPNDVSGADNQPEQEQPRNVQNQTKNRNRGQKRRQRNNVNRMPSLPIPSLFPVSVAQENFDLRNVLSSQAAGDAGPWWHQRHQPGYQQIKKPRTDNNWKKRNQNASDKTEEPIEDILNPLKYAIVPVDYPTNLLSEEQFERLQALLMEKILEIEDEEQIPRFWRSYLRHGSLLVFSANDKSREWLMNVVPSITLDNDLKLKTGPAKDIILTRKIHTLVPKLLNDLNQDQILKLLKNQNSGLRCELWNVLDCQSDEKGRTFTLAIDEESFKYSRNTSFKSHLGLGIIKFTNIQYYNVVQTTTN